MYLVIILNFSFFFFNFGPFTRNYRNKLKKRGIRRNLGSHKREFANYFLFLCDSTKFFDILLVVLSTF